SRELGAFELGTVDATPAFDQLATELIGPGVVHGEHAVDHAGAQVEHRELARGAVSAPDRLVVTGGLAAVLEVHVVLIGPEVGKLAVRLVAVDDRGRDATSVVFRHLPVLDPDRAAQHRVRVQRNVAADVNVRRRAQTFIDAHAAALDRQAQSSGQVEVRLDADRDQDQVGLLAGAVGERYPGDAAAGEVPLADRGSRP